MCSRSEEARRQKEQSRLHLTDKACLRFWTVSGNIIGPDDHFVPLEPSSRCFFVQEALVLPKQKLTPTVP